MTGSSEGVLALAARLTAEVITNTIVVVARVADWALEQIQSDTKRFLTMGGSEYYQSRAEDLSNEYDDEASIRQCPCGRRLNYFVTRDCEYYDWRHDDDNTRACDDMARELFDIKWENWPGHGMVIPARNDAAIELLKVNPEEYFRLHNIWRFLPKD